MDNNAAGFISGVNNDNAINSTYRKNNANRERKLNILFEELTDEVREDLITYLNRMGLAGEAQILVIPSTHHYFFDAEDLRGVKTVINLKQLNYVREIREFLSKISEMLPNNSSFVGCFIDNKSKTGFSDKYSNLPRQISEKAEAYENGIESRIPFINRMYSFIDARTNRYLTKRTVSHLLEECSLQLVSMTELNGLTYFCTRKTKSVA
jgi:hypothetical protein